MFNTQAQQTPSQRVRRARQSTWRRVIGLLGATVMVMTSVACGGGGGGSSSGGGSGADTTPSDVDGASWDEFDWDSGDWARIQISHFNEEIS